METKVIIQNDVVNSVVDSNVQQTTHGIFEKVIGLDKYDHIADDITKNMLTELQNESFMTVDLELNDKQKEVLRGAVRQLVSKCVKNYVNGIKTDERTEKIIGIVEEDIRSIVERTLHDIGQEVNRGCIINSVAVKADAKNDNYNTIELRHGKRSGDITVPTKGIFISTNCVELIQNSIKVNEENI